MDKQLIERLAREAALWPELAVPVNETTEAAADAASLNANLLAQWGRFAALVAEECAKDAEDDRRDATWSGEAARLAAAARIRAKFSC